jgi:carboxymethylenebutenolidase
MTINYNVNMKRNGGPTEQPGKKSSYRVNKLGKVFDDHIKCEFERFDIDATMKTMTKEPYVHHIPTLTGGIGYSGVYNFYKDELIGKMPNDTKFVRISRTIDKNQVVDELILSFTHDKEIEFMLPGIPPTGKYVEIPHVVVMKFNEGKIAHEHIYWDQASLLVQIGLLDPKRLPVSGIEQTRMLMKIRKGLESCNTNTNTIPNR